MGRSYVAVQTSAAYNPDRDVQFYDISVPRLRVVEESQDFIMEQYIEPLRLFNHIHRSRTPKDGRISNNVVEFTSSCAQLKLWTLMVYTELSKDYWGVISLVKYVDHSHND